ncbi:MAG: dynamin family protein [Bacteroidota bacterium]
MKSLITDRRVPALQARLAELARDLHELTIHHPIDGNVESIASELREQVRENFMFVIVGEVNAGKSSFVNALVGTDVAKTDAAICTQDVQKIVYGEEHEIVQEREHLMRVSVPEPILKEITIVDTPGTNSRVTDHQEITTDFIPHSNLVVFVFFAGNPHVESAWQFFRHISNEWRKKVVFVLTKSDMFAESPEELQRYHEMVLQYATEEGVADPRVFVVSAKREMAGREGSGYEALRGYINQEVLGTAAMDKIKDDLQTIKKLAGDISSSYQQRQDRFTKDAAVREEIRSMLVQNQKEAEGSVGQLAHSLLKVYDLNTKETLQEMEQGIGFFALTGKSIMALFGKQNSPKDWMYELKGDLEKRLRKQFDHTLENGLGQVRSNIQYMAISIRDKIDAIEHSLKDSKTLFTKLDEERHTILYRLKDEFRQFTENSEAFRGTNVFGDKIPSYTENIASGGGLAAIGTVLAVVTQGVVFDVTGGLLATLGFLVAGVSAALKRRKIMRQARQAVKENRLALEEKVNAWLSEYISDLIAHIDSHMTDFDAFLKQEGETLAKYEERAASLNAKVEALHGKLS